LAAKRAIRFGISGGGSGDPAKLLKLAQRAEQVGFATFGLPDHFMLPLGPLVALQAVADATANIRLTHTVLAVDFRHPAVLAKELATLDLFSGGRLQVGIGAGWMRDEHEQVGIPFYPAPIRIERLEEAILVLKGLFGDGPFSLEGKHFTITALEGLPRPVQRPHPPIMVGGGGRKLLAMAARHADIIQVMPPTRSDGASGPHQTGAEAYAEKVGWVREQAGDRFDEIELGAQLLTVSITDRPHDAIAEYIERQGAFMARIGRGSTFDAQDLLASPMVAVGSLDAICEKLLAVRDAYGISYFAAPVLARPEDLAPVIEHLTGK
jgi:probable F420-dependent oxidoreductase